MSDFSHSSSVKLAASAVEVGAMDWRCEVHVIGSLASCPWSEAISASSALTSAASLSAATCDLSALTCSESHSGSSATCVWSPLTRSESPSGSSRRLG